MIPRELPAHIIHLGLVCLIYFSFCNMEKSSPVLPESTDVALAEHANSYPESSSGSFFGDNITHGSRIGNSGDQLGESDGDTIPNTPSPRRIPEQILQTGQH